jgi:hypothetical protein
LTFLAVKAAAGGGGGDGALARPGAVLGVLGVLDRASACWRILEGALVAGVGVGVGAGAGDFSDGFLGVGVSGGFGSAGGAAAFFVVAVEVFRFGALFGSVAAGIGFLGRPRFAGVVVVVSMLAWRGSVGVVSGVALWRKTCRR